MKERIKMLIMFVLGAILTGTTVYAATIISSINVGYNNASSKLVATNVQDAIDEVYKKASESKAPQPKNENIKAMYYYDENKESEDFCVTGDEKTCKVNTCYLNNTEGSCSPGTIVEYMVNEKEKIRFHVVHDDGEKLTLQSQKNIEYNIPWNLNEDSNTNINNVLNILENKTSTWTNVNKFNYSIGRENSTLGYSGCFYSNCNINIYELDKKEVNVRMITVQEATILGCKFSDGTNIPTCPIWLYNYLQRSMTYEGTVNDYQAYLGYYTMTISSGIAVHIRANGVMYVDKIEANINRYGGRAVVEITKS